MSLKQWLFPSSSRVLSEDLAVNKNQLQDNSLLIDYHSSIQSNRGDIQLLIDQLEFYADRNIQTATVINKINHLTNNIILNRDETVCLDEYSYLSGFLTSHHTMSRSTVELFASSSYSESIISPLLLWLEELNQFELELFRTENSYSSMNECKLGVDNMLVEKCEAPNQWTEEKELLLMLKKTDLQSSAINYNSRLEGISEHAKLIQENKLRMLNNSFQALMQLEFQVFSQPIQTALHIKQHNYSFIHPLNSPSTASFASPSSKFFNNLHSPFHKFNLGNGNSNDYIPATFLYHTDSNSSSPAVSQLYNKRNVMTTEELALLEALKQLHQAVNNKNQTEIENQQLKQRVEQLQKHNQSSSEESGHSANPSIASTQHNPAAAAVQEFQEIIQGDSAAVPAAPGLDVPTAPALNSEQNHSNSTAKSRLELIREKEIQEATKHRLPILPPAHVLEDSQHLKKLHWQSVNAAEVHNTVWRDLIRYPNDQQKQNFIPALIVNQENNEARWNWRVESELAGLFTVRSKDLSLSRRNSLAISEEVSISSNSSGSLDKKELIELLEAKRSYTISISLSHLNKLSYEAIRRAILSMDNSVLSISLLELLNEIMPTSDEVQLIQSYKGSVENLAGVERFFAVLIEDIEITDIKNRLRAWLYMESFNGLIQSINSCIQLLRDTIQQLRGAHKFQSLLGLILFVGNCLNSSNAVQQCYGYHLTSLNKLNLIKGEKNINLLRFILEYYLNPLAPELNDFPADLFNLQQAKNIEQQFLKAEIRQIKQFNCILANLITHSEKDKESKYPLPPRLVQFYTNTAVAALSRLESDYSILCEEYSSLCAYYSISADMSWESFFQLIHNFVEVFSQEQQHLIIEKQLKQRNDTKNKVLQAIQQHKQQQAQSSANSATQPA
jgi:hypothetical protein